MLQKKLMDEERYRRSREKREGSKDNAFLTQGPEESRDGVTNETDSMRKSSLRRTRTSAPSGR